jgi:hypothetical protein
MGEAGSPGRRVMRRISETVEARVLYGIFAVGAKQARSDENESVRLTRKDDTDNLNFVQQKDNAIVHSSCDWRDIELL